MLAVACPKPAGKPAVLNKGLLECDLGLTPPFCKDKNNTNGHFAVAAHSVETWPELLVCACTVRGAFPKEGPSGFEK